ncbi:tetratricopeptide repeat protein, partial [Acinetobacter baumannii]
LTTDEDRQFITNAANVCLTQVYFELGKYDTALYYCERAYSGVVESNEIDRQCTMLQLKAIIYQELNRFAESVLPAKKAVDI